VAINPRRLRPSELCPLVNSTPLGTVLDERQLLRHRTRAGFRKLMAVDKNGAPAWKWCLHPQRLCQRRQLPTGAQGGGPEFLTRNYVTERTPHYHCKDRRGTRVERVEITREC